MPLTQPPPRRHENEEEHRRKLALSIEQVLLGKTNNIIDITLTPNSTQTLVFRDRINIDTRVSLMPKSASAAAATGLWIAVTLGKMTVNHDSNAATDRVFGATLVG